MLTLFQNNHVCKLLLLFSFPLTAHAQQYFAGKVYKDTSDEVLGAVTVEDLASGKYDHTDMGGNFKIEASLGDRVVFSFAGYHSDTLTVSAAMLRDRQEVYLVPNFVQLQTVRVGDLNAYQVDSLQRIQDYESFYHDHTPTGVLAHSTPESGFGITFSPISYFSKKDEDKRKLRKRLARDEEAFYIDYRFSRNYVGKLTRLNGDSLTEFMGRYRPTYKFCRAANDQDIMNYVNVHYKEFMKR